MTRPISTFVKDVPDSDQRFAQLLDELVRQLQTGDGQAIEAFLRAHPREKSQLQQLIPTMLAMAEIAARDGGVDGDLSSDAMAADVAGSRMLGDFRIVREIGRGGMGVVYEAEQVSLQRKVAIKILPLAAVMDPRALQRFRNEVQAAAMLQHQNIVPVYYVGCERGIHYYAMQYVDGHTLEDVISEQRRLEGFDVQDGVSESSGASRLARITAALTNGLPPHPTLSPEDGGEGTGAGIVWEDGRVRAAIHADRRGLPPHPALSPEDGGEGSAAGAHSDGQTRVASETVRLAGVSTDGSVRRGEYYYRNLARLGIQAAEALDHAHMRGVLHRDIKPSNLMVDTTGNLWITDFGLARLESDASLTVSGHMVGTLRYMSPEQALGKRAVVDQRTDIYSLGVTLYELLALRPAFPARDRQDLLKEIASEEPTALRKIKKSIPWELETIVLKAMSKEPEQRYATAQELADDLCRFLDQRPIHARRPSLGQRVIKWARRHVAVVLGAILFSSFAAILLGISAFTISLEQSKTQTALEDSQESLRFARQSVDEMYTQVAEKWLADSLVLTQTQQDFLDKALRIYQRLAAGAATDPQSQWEAALAYQHVARIRHRLGHYRQAKSAYNRSISLQSWILGQFPNHPDHRAELAATYQDLSRLHMAEEQLPEAEVALRRAEELYEPLREQFPDEPEYQAALAANQLARAMHLDRAGNHAQAEQLAHQAHATYDALHGEFHATLDHSLHEPDGYVSRESQFALECAVERAHSAVFLARLLRHKGELQQAEKLCSESVNTCTGLISELPDSRTLRRMHVAALTELGDVLVAAGRLEEAETPYRQALQAGRESMRIETSPHTFFTTWLVKRSEWLNFTEPDPFCDDVEISIRLGSLLGRLRKSYEAQQYLGETIRVAGVLADMYPQTRYGVAEANAYAELAMLLREKSAQDSDTAMQLARKAWRELLAHFPIASSYRSGLHTSQSDLEWFSANFSDPRVTPAEQTAEGDLAQSASMATLAPLNITLGVAYYRYGNWRGAIERLQSYSDFGTGGDSFSWFYMAMAHWQAGDQEQAVVWFQKASAWMNENKAGNQELRRLRAEAAELLGVREGAADESTNPEKT